jgi:hypothetical protein
MTSPSAAVRIPKLRIRNAEAFGGAITFDTITPTELLVARVLQRNVSEVEMRRTALFLAFIAPLALSPIACSRSDNATGQTAVADKDADGEEITVTGCLTGAPDRAAFVVTADRTALTSDAMYSRSGEVPTYTYELVGSNDLAAHVGRQVQVKGRLGDRDDEVDVESESKTTQPQTQAGDDKVTPTVETDEEMEIKVRRLHVEAIAPTGQACPAGK